MNKASAFALVNGEPVPANEPLIPVVSRGFMYGDGCFETFRSYKGKFLHLDEHIRRLEKGLRYLHMQADISTDKLKEQALFLCEKNGISDEDAVISIQCTRRGAAAGMGGLQNEADIFITAREVSAVALNYTLKTVKIRAIPEQSLTRTVKWTGSVNFIKAAAEAAEQGADDALMLTNGGFISETAIANIFWLSGNKVFTPDSKCDLLPGITRKIVLGIISEMEEIEIVEGLFLPEALHAAETVWVTNSVREILPVHKIDDTRYRTSHPFLWQLQREWFNYKEEILGGGGI